MMLDLLTNPRTMREICSGVAAGQCALCQSDLQTFLDELACPHWFIAPGYAAFRLRRLVRVFQVYDVDSVMQYLKIVAACKGNSETRSAVVDTTSFQTRDVAITWRKRRWEFQQRMTSDGKCGGNEFVISIYYCGEIVEEGIVKLDTFGAGTITILQHASSSLRPTGNAALELLRKWARIDPNE